jgi:hypothetical protein
MRPLPIRRIAAALLAVTALCHPAIDAAPPADGAAQEPRLTPAAARAALVVMIEQKPEYQREFLGLKALTDGKALRFDDKSDGLPEGVWDCRGLERTFAFARATGNGGLYSCNGVFEPTKTGWQAKVTRELRAHPRP